MTNRKLKVYHGRKPATAWGDRYCCAVFDLAELKRLIPTNESGLGYGSWCITLDPYEVSMAMASPHVMVKLGHPG